MPARATGQVRRLADGWEARITVGPSKRKGFALVGCRSDTEAEQRTLVMATLAQRVRQAGHGDAVVNLLGMAAVRRGPALDEVLRAADALCAGKTKPLRAEASITFKQLAAEWSSGKLHERFPDEVPLKRTHGTDAKRLAKLFRTIGDVPLVDFTVNHALEAMRSLPEWRANRKTGTGDERPRPLTRATRRQYAQLIAKVLNLAVYPCRIIERSPLPKGFLPKVGKPPAFSYLYPDEDRLLLGCKEVPLPFRLLYGFLAREGMRVDEALQLRWRDVDLQRGVVTLDENKTDDPRAWALSPGAVRALSSWKPEQVDEEALIFAGAQHDHQAEAFRAHLKLAKVTRSELFQTTETRRRIRVHDLRGTFVTLSLANGKTETWVADRTGHRSSVMLNRYRRAARSAQELRLGELAPLHLAIPELAEEATKRPGSIRRRAPRWRKSSESLRYARQGSNLRPVD